MKKINVSTLAASFGSMSQTATSPRILDNYSSNLLAKTAKRKKQPRQLSWLQKVEEGRKIVLAQRKKEKELALS